MGRPVAASACLVVAAIALFVAHEPLLVMIGARGTRAKREHGSRALRHGLGWATVALASGLVGLWLGGEPVIRAALIPLGFAMVMTPIILRGSEKTLVGEIGAAVTLAAAATPVAVAGGLAFNPSLAVWGTWVVAFTANTAAVRWVISAHKDRRNRSSIGAAAIVTTAAVVLATQSAVFLAAFPNVLLSWVLIVKPPNPRHLKRVGWTLLVGGLLTAAIAITIIRVE